MSKHKNRVDKDVAPSDVTPASQGLNVLSETPFDIDVELKKALSEEGTVVTKPTIIDHLQAAIDLLAPMALKTNPCLEQAHSLLATHVIHLVKTGLKQ